MKAAQINQYGGQDVLQVTNGAEKPKPGPDQVVVEVSAAGLNPFDWKVREGYMKDFIPLQFPATLGGDLAGTVAEVGENVSGFTVGQAVYGMANAVSGSGSYAEFTRVTASQLVAQPKSIDPVTAAALPLAGVSAYQAVVDHINLQPNQKILIHGGAGGIGTLAIQIAKNIGATVATTASTDDLEYVKELGADVVIDYTQQDFSKELSDYDAVFDTVGGETATKSFDVLKEGGTLVSMVEQSDNGLAAAKNITFIPQQSKTTQERLTKLAELADAGAIKIHIDKVFSLDQAPEALEYLKTGHPRGKVVIRI